jgi:hypothetical protein
MNGLVAGYLVSLPSLYPSHNSDEYIKLILIIHNVPNAMFQYQSLLYESFTEKMTCCISKYAFYPQQLDKFATQLGKTITN